MAATSVAITTYPQKYEHIFFLSSVNMLIMSLEEKMQTKRKQIYLYYVIMRRVYIIYFINEKNQKIKF